MVGGLRVTRQLPHRTARVHRRIHDHLPELGRTDVMRATKRRQQTVFGEQFQRAQVDFLVPAQRVVEACSWIS